MDTNISQGIQLLNAAATSPPPGGSLFTTTLGPTFGVNIGDGSGPVPNPANWPSGPNNGGSEYADVTSGYLRVPTSGLYTFNVNSDDGAMLAFPNATSGFVATNNATAQTYNGSAADIAFVTRTDGGNRGAENSFGAIFLNAGVQPFVLVHQQGGGGSEATLLSAPGNLAATGFNATTVAGTGVVGYTPLPSGPGIAGVGTWQYSEFTHGSSTSLGQAITLYNNGSPAAGTTVFQGPEPTINFISPTQVGANKGDAVAFPGSSPGNDSNFGAGAHTTLTVPASGANYTFDVLADDSNQFQILHADGTPVVGAFLSVFGGGNSLLSDKSGFNDNGACCGDVGGTVHLAAGTYTLEGIFNQQQGGASWEVYGATGVFNGFNSNFELLGSQTVGPFTLPNTFGGLAFAPEPSTFVLGGLGLVGLFVAVRRRRKN